ncbi:MAG: ChbG/HpnK family deacetylase [Anaerohalosphaeraceae bacterium]|nr:ChbG/HpnK family deacetylase [Anaerohalosphaeraceae bacterium]
MTKRVIINADDFGLCGGVNDAIANAHSDGVLTSATLMANMPAAGEAAAMAKQMPDLGVGVHLNILEGKPVSQDAKVDVLLGKNGEFKFSPLKLAVMSFFSAKIRDAVEIELGEQIRWVINNGITPSHLDSHKHFHCFGTIYKIVCRLAKKFGIAAIRWPWEPATVCQGDWPKVRAKDRRRALIVRNLAKCCEGIDNRFIKNDLFFGLAHTGCIDGNFWAELGQTQFAGIAEVMTHPGYSERIDATKTRLVAQRQLELKWLCEQSTKDILGRAEIELTHYGKIDRD